MTANDSHSGLSLARLTTRIFGAVLWMLIPVAVWLAWQSRLAQSQEETDEPGGAPVSVTAVPDFELTAHTGDTVTQAFLQGQPSVVGFVFTRCVTTCPAITLAMKNLRDEIGDANVRFLTVTVDPKHDTPEVLANYADVYQADPAEWLFATGSSADTFRLINLGFGMYAEEMFGADRRPGYEVAHTNRIVLLNENAVPVRSFLAINDGDMAALKRILTGKKKMPDPPQRTVQVTPPDSKTAGETPPNEEKVSSPQTTGKTPNQLLPLPEWLARLPDVNAGLNSLATVLLLFGFVAVKQKRLQLHKTLMLTAFAASIAFLGCYLLHHYGLYKWTGSGSKKFTGTGIVRPVYFAILISHVVLAMLVPVLALITIVRGLKDQREKHRRIARITFPIWLYVSVSGVVIYGFLYHWPVSN